MPLPLNYFLHLRNPAISQICSQCNNGIEDLQHFLFHCPVYHNIREITLNVFYRKQYYGITTDIESLITDPEGRVALINYFFLTKRFGS